MGTSRSSRWTVTAHLFSGRPDPAWEVTAEQASELVTKLEQLPEVETGTPSPSRSIGYRGVTLNGPDGGNWLASEGTIVGSGAGIHRKDGGRVWERALLETAPPGYLPPIDLSKS